MYNPLQLADKIEPLVAPKKRGKQLRWYHRFRVDRWYGGIVTGDVVGCNLRCGFCWAWRFAWKTKGRLLLSAEEAASKLYRLAERRRKHGRRIKQVRLSGGEPTIGFGHLVELIEETTSRGLHFVVETNGILVGARREYADRLAEFHGAGIEVRVSIKGANPREFYELTRATPSAWSLQLKALENLVSAGLEPGEEVYPAVMLSFNPSPARALEELKKTLKRIDEKLAESIEPEYVILYPHVERLLEKRGLKPRTKYRPEEVPPELV